MSRNTRKIKRHFEEPVVPIVQKKNEPPHYWSRFLEEGDELYNYLINNFNNMLTADIIKHFNIRYGVYSLYPEMKEFRNKYGMNIQKELIEWIRLEYSEGRLFNKDLWKPFRDTHKMTSMYFGYKKMFHYIADDSNNYYLQLAVEQGCEEECITCDGNFDDIHFELIFFGYRDEENKFQPFNIIEISDENMMVGRFWNKY